MEKNRLEAFSDGVIAVAITILVLELKVPHSTEWKDLSALLPLFLSHVLSFVNVGIYWNNHHHLLHTVEKVDGRILWANLHLLFWLVLMPWATGWMGENHFAPLTVAFYGFVLLMSGFAYWILQNHIIDLHGKDHVLARAVGKDFKGKTALASYLVSVPVAFYFPMVSLAIYAAVAAMWFLPDRRIEKALQSH